MKRFPFLYFPLLVEGKRVIAEPFGFAEAMNWSIKMGCFQVSALPTQTLL